MSRSDELRPTSIDVANPNEDTLVELTGLIGDARVAASIEETLAPHGIRFRNAATDCELMLHLVEDRSNLAILDVDAEISKVEQTLRILRSIPTLSSVRVILVAQKIHPEIVELRDRFEVVDGLVLDYLSDARRPCSSTGASKHRPRELPPDPEFFPSAEFVCALLSSKRAEDPSTSSQSSKKSGISRRPHRGARLEAPLPL